MKAKMTKKKAPMLSEGVTLMAVGASIALLTPIFQEVLIKLLSLDCPISGDRRVCDLTTGLQNAYFIFRILSAWLIVGLAILVIGIVKYFADRNTSKKSKPKSSTREK